MRDMKFILPGQETVTLTGQTIDKLIRAGDGDAALLYLYILKTRGQSTSEQAAAAMGRNPGGIATAMAVLSRLGLVQFGETTDAPDTGDAGDTGDTHDTHGATPAGSQKGAPHDSQEGEPPRAPVGEPRNYTVEEIKLELEPGTVFHALAEETQRRLGKILSPDELMRLFGIYDGLGLQPEVIMQLIMHCITESRSRSAGRMPSMRNIEKKAYEWEHEGILTLERAEEHLKAHDARKSARGEIKKVLQIRDRELSGTEKRYMDSWIAMGFDTGAIETAYDKTVVKTGRLAWEYMDSIMNSWHSRDMHTLHEIPEREKKVSGSVDAGDAKAHEQQFGAANQEEIKQMQQILEKIKET